MGEIVNLEHYRKLRSRREADAEYSKTAKLGDRRDGAGSKGASGLPAADRADSNRAGRDGAAKSGDDTSPD